MQYNVDRVAGVLAHLGRTAAAMAPAWDGAECWSLAAGPDGQYLGRMLHGRGLELGADLKHFGITRPIPHVYERSLVGRCVDYARDQRPEIFLRPYYSAQLRRVVRPNVEQAAIRAASIALALGLARHGSPFALPTALGAITTYDGIVSARAGGQGDDNSFVKASLTTAANLWFSLWRAGGMPVAGTFLATTAPTEAACDRSTVGALAQLRNPAGTNRKYLLSFGFSSSSTLNFGCLADLQVQGGAFRLTVATAETVASPVAAPRSYGTAAGAGNQIVFVVTTATSATGHTLTVSYVNQAGGSTSVAYVHPATAIIADGLWPTSFAPFVPLASGDYGVRSVSQTQSGTALAAGVLNLMLYYPLCYVPGVAANSYIERPLVALDGLIELVNATQVIGALTLLVNTNSTTSGVVNAFVKSCEG